jgi:hypothetical protein
MMKSFFETGKTAQRKIVSSLPKTSPPIYHIRIMNHIEE